MELSSVQQRIFCVQQFVLSKSIVSVQREFRLKFGDDRQHGAAPSRKIIGHWVRQLRETGSVQVKSRTRWNTVRSLENIQRVRIALERSPRRSVRRHSQPLNLSDGSMWRILRHDLHFHPYKQQIVQELTAAHKALRFRFCQQMVHTHADLQFTGPYCSRLFYGGIWNLKFLLIPFLTLTALKMQFVRRFRMLRRTLYVASWQVYLGDGSNALIVMEDISKTLYWRCEAFFVNPRHWLT